MRKALTGILLALAVMGAAAGLSGREMANEELRDIKERWAQLQSLPPAYRQPAEVAELKQQAEGLASRFPGREEIRVWERIIDRSSRDWRKYGSNAG